MALIDKILNEDGTVCEPPVNPLWEKWEKLYPPTPMPQYSQVCNGYTCMWCDRCPSGDYWEVPEEDREAYEEHSKKVTEYMKLHNPSLKNIL